MSSQSQQFSISLTDEEKALALPGSRGRQRQRQAAIDKINSMIQRRKAEMKVLLAQRARLKRELANTQYQIEQIEKAVNEDRAMIRQLKQRGR